MTKCGCWYTVVSVHDDVMVMSHIQCMVMTKWLVGDDDVRLSAYKLSE